MDFEIKLFDHKGRALVKGYYNNSLVSKGFFANCATEMIDVDGEEVQRYRAKYDGLWKYYNEAGKVRSAVIFEKGKIISEKNYLCANDLLFIKDIKRDVSAEIKKKIEIKLCGDTTVSFRLLKCNGVSTGEYYHNGKLFMKGHYMDGNKDGTYYQSYNCEQDEWADILSECMVVVKDGLWKHYNDGGKLVREETWKADSLISVKTFQ